MKISEHFDLREFVDPLTYLLRGDKSAELVDIRLISLVEFIRNAFGVPVIVNNWHTGGQYKESGLRPLNSKTGATYSQHKFGRAADLKIEGLEPEYVRNVIRKNWPKFRAAGLTTIEKDTPTWVHIDIRFTGLQTLLEVPYR